MGFSGFFCGDCTFLIINIARELNIVYEKYYVVDRKANAPLFSEEHL